MRWRWCPLKHDGDWTVVDQIHLHVLTEHSLFYETQPVDLLQPLDHMLIEWFGNFGWRRGNERRPSFVSAAPPEVAEPLYEHVVQRLQEVDGLGFVKKGMFGQHMQVDLVNDGPVTIMLERAPSPPHQQC